MKLLLQKIASLFRRHLCNRQPPLRQGEFQFRTRVAHRTRSIGSVSEPTMNH